MQIRAVISNKQHQEYGVMTIPFPILENQYTEILNMLGQLSLGDGFLPDCHVDELRGDVPILKRLEGTEVNIDELDYLAKRLDSFTDDELAQFQSMAYKGGYPRIADNALIADVEPWVESVPSTRRRSYEHKNGEPRRQLRVKRYSWC